MEAYEYDSAYNRLIGTVLKGFVRADELVGQVGRHRSRHDGPSRNVGGESPLDHEQVQIQVQAGIHHDTILYMDIDGHTEFLAELGKSNVEEMRDVLLRSVSQVCEAAGNSKDMGGAQISHDMILDLIEMVDVQFDKDGNPSMPSLVIHPDTLKKLMQQHQTPEHDHRYQQIMARKKEKWQENLRQRKLSPL